MPLSDIRIVLDTNTFLRGLAAPDSTSGRIVSAIGARKVVLLTSKRVLDEYRVILLDPELIDRFPPLTPKTVEAAIRSIAYLSENLGRHTVRFPFPRDRRDEKFLALAIAGRATHLITFDEDLLSLAVGHSDAAKRLRQRLPGLQILMPGDFLREHGHALLAT